MTKTMSKREYNITPLAALAFGAGVVGAFVFGSVKNSLNKEPEPVTTICETYQGYTNPNDSDIRPYVTYVFDEAVPEQRYTPPRRWAKSKDDLRKVLEVGEKYCFSARGDTTKVVELIGTPIRASEIE